MFIIGELINGMYKNISGAIKSKDKTEIQKTAIAQIQAGADALDVNCGPASRDPVSDIQWLVEVIQEVTNKPLSLDSSKTEVISSGLKVCRNEVVINSTTADEEKLGAILPLAKKYNAKLIGLTISQKGIPQNKDQRLELAAKIIGTCLEQEFPTDNLYLDPIVMPVNVAQIQMQDILESIREFGLLSEPRSHTIIGLSNVSQGATNRSLINRTFLTLAISYGLDAAILNPLDKHLMETSIASELILNKHIYCDSFLDAYKKK